MRQQFDWSDTRASDVALPVTAGLKPNAFEEITLFWLDFVHLDHPSCCDGEACVREARFPGTTNRKPVVQ